jgi:hypothetical protein
VGFRWVLDSQHSSRKKTNKLIPAITINAGAETMISNQLPQFSCVQAFMDFQLCLALHHPKPLFILPAAIPHAMSSSMSDPTHTHKPSVTTSPPAERPCTLEGFIECPQRGGTGCCDASRTMSACPTGYSSCGTQFLEQGFGGACCPK